MTYQPKPKALWHRAIHGDKPKPKKRKPCRKVSKAQSKRLRVYHARVKVWKKGRRCIGELFGIVDLSLGVVDIPCCCLLPHLCDDCHHTRGKLGPLLMDERYWVPVCRGLHDWIDRNQAKAKALGLIQGPWNHQPTEGVQMSTPTQETPERKEIGCIYCGLKMDLNEDGASGKMADHITQCDKSPLVQAIAEMQAKAAAAIQAERERAEKAESELRAEKARHEAQWAMRDFPKYAAEMDAAGGVDAVIARDMIHGMKCRRLERELAGIAENRDHFCHHINLIAKALGTDKDNSAPEAVLRKVVALQAELAEAETTIRFALQHGAYESEGACPECGEPCADDMNHEEFCWVGKLSGWLERRRAAK